MMKFNVQKTKLSISAVTVILVVALLCAGCVETKGTEEKVLRVVFNEGPDTGAVLILPTAGQGGMSIRQASMKHCFTMMQT